MQTSRGASPCMIPKIADFGLARRKTHRSIGVAQGNYAYAAPEVMTCSNYSEVVPEALQTGCELNLDSWFTTQ